MYHNDVSMFEYCSRWQQNGISLIVENSWKICHAYPVVNLGEVGEHDDNEEIVEHSSHSNLT